MLIELLIAVLVVGLLVWLALYAIDLFPIAAPFNQIAKGIVIVIAIVYLAEKFLV